MPLVLRPPIGGLAVGLAALVAAAGPARAQVALEVTGPCPAPAEVERAFAAEGLMVAATGVPVWIGSDGRSASLEIGDGELYRVIEGADCAAIADAFALIASTFLASHRPAAAQPPVAAVESPVTAVGPPPLLAPPGVTRAAVARPAPRAAARRYWIGGLVGLDQSMAPDDTIAFGSLEVGAGLTRNWAARVAVARNPATNHGLVFWDEHLSGRIELLRRRAGASRFLSPALGAGLVMSTVEPLTGWSQTRVTRLHPVLTGGLVGGYALASFLVLRAELDFQLFPWADRYLLESEGEIGSSPRAIASFGVGLEIGLGR